MSQVSKIPLVTIPGFSKLVADYISGNPALRHLYKYDLSIDTFAQVMADKAKDPIDRPLLVSVLKRQYRNVDASDKTKLNIDSLLSPDTFTVTAAHQPCVLLGPVFNIYKISSTINLANQLKAKYPEKNFVPVFWMGSEDHDFEELGTTYIYGKKIEWPAAAGEGGAYGRRRLDTFVNVLNEAELILGEAGKPLIDKMRAGLDKFTRFGEYTRYIINELFADTGLVVIDQDDAELKQRFAPIIQDELEHSSAIKALDPTLQWLEAKYSVQATPREINLFYLADNIRDRIVRQEGELYTNTLLVHGSRVRIPTGTQKQDYSVFSPNVILRPVYQELILPNLAFIGGAGELSYWLELKPVFEHHKVNYPMLVMRSSMTVINTSQLRKLEKLGLSVVDFLGNIDTLISNFVKSKLSAEMQFDVETKTLEALYDSIAIKAETVDPTLKGTVLAEKQKQLNALQALEGRIVKAEKRKQEDAINQIKALHAAIAPQNSWQERIENFSSFYVKDPNYIQHIVEAADPFQRAMLVLNLDGV
ncbi:MAG: bacillithiol biosynthesis cysteine-adding enzyme BshC [Bacteroidetes bacterium]|nr:bacillithiol biosynthesis cysteine-adding enzyme BshC [Bacteroidota bacterium]